MSNGHNFITVGEDERRCGGCDARPGSRASQKPCPAAPPAPLTGLRLCPGCGVHRTSDEWVGPVDICDWCTDWQDELEQTTNSIINEERAQS